MQFSLAYNGDKLKSLVDNGTLTRVQANAVGKVFPFGNHHNPRGQKDISQGASSQAVSQ